MLTFTLAISCLTTSDLPWFMDLTFQIPMQYCSLQHWTLLLSPVTSTTTSHGLGIRNEAGQRLIEFCQENALVIANTFFQQHKRRLDTWTCFCFGYIPSFFLELFLYWSPVAYWALTNLGSSSFSILSFCFHTVHWVLKARILKWFAIPFSSGPHSVSTHSLGTNLLKEQKSFPEAPNYFCTMQWQV